MGLAVVLLMLRTSTVAQASQAISAENVDIAAAPRRAVIVVSATKQDSLALLRAELQALGLEVVEVPVGDAPTSSASFPALTDPPEEFRIVLRPTYVEVWIFDRAAGKVTLREVFAESDGTALDARTAVLHAVELLRWHLREREPKTRRDSPTKTASLPVAPRDDGERIERRNAWLFSLVPQVLHSPGGTAPGIGIEIDAAWRWSRMAARLFASSVLMPNELSSSEGSAQVTSRFLGVQAVLLSSETPKPSGFEASLGLGVALVSTELRGTASSGYRAHDDHLLTAAPILDLRGSYALSRSLAIALCASLMTPPRSNSLRFADREAARYGTLIATAGIGPRITLF